MLWQWSPSVIAEVVASASLMVLAIYFPWRDLNRRVSSLGATLLLICALWMLSHALEIGLPIASYKSYLMGAQLVWGTIAITLWFFYIAHYIGPRRLLARRIYILFGVVPLVALLAIVTNHVYGLMWTAPGLDSNNPYLPLSPTYGIVYWVCILYYTVLVVAGSFLIIRSVFRLRLIRRLESIWLIVAAFIPLLVSLAEVMGVSSSLKLAVGATPWAAFIGAVIVLWNLPQFHLQKVIPIARDTVFQRISDCIVVLDMQNRVLDLNPAAEKLIGCSVSSALGLPVKQISPDWPNQVITSGENLEASRELVLEQSDKQKTYNLRVSTITDLGGRPTSKVLLLTDITERKRAEEELQQSYQKLQKAMEGAVQAIASTSETRDPYTAGHQQRVAKLACAIAEEMGFPKEKLEGIRVAATLHDIGKINVPSEILSKPGRLSEIEMSIIKTHPKAGNNILKTLELPWAICPSVLQHHERMDGSGYPKGLLGEDITIEAKILAVADVVEAMSSHRPYRPAFGIDEALEEIKQKKGILYDPDVVDACLKLFTEKGFKFE